MLLKFSINSRHTRWHLICILHENRPTSCGRTPINVYSSTRHDFLLLTVFSVGRWPFMWQSRTIFQCVSNRDTRSIVSSNMIRRLRHRASMRNGNGGRRQWDSKTIAVAGTGLSFALKVQYELLFVAGRMSNCMLPHTRLAYTHDRPSAVAKVRDWRSLKVPIILHCNFFVGNECVFCKLHDVRLDSVACLVCASVAVPVLSPTLRSADAKDARSVA